MVAMFKVSHVRSYGSTLKAGTVHMYTNSPPLEGCRGLTEVLLLLTMDLSASDVHLRLRPPKCRSMHDKTLSSASPEHECKMCYCAHKFTHTHTHRHAHKHEHMYTSTHMYIHVHPCTQTTRTYISTQSHTCICVPTYK